MTSTARFDLTPIDAADLSAVDLAEEILDESDVECYIVRTFDEDGMLSTSEAGQLVYWPTTRRGGIAWGADASWTDADFAEEVVERYLDDSMVP